VSRADMFCLPNHRCITIMSESPIKRVLFHPEGPKNNLYCIFSENLS